MDDRGATQFFDAIHNPTAELERDDAAPRYMIVLCGGIPGAMLTLAQGPNWIGRASDNSLQFPEHSISRHHALVRVNPDGPVTLTDLGSTNGTFLNGQRIDPDLPVPLEDGDRIRVGSLVVVKYVRPDPYEEQFQKEMFERTVRDSLTGLYNRAYFLDQLTPLAKNVAENGLGMAVMMLDIDHFKNVNDTLGHSIGDAVLREVADVLRQSARSDDLIARFGGEEFILALPVSTARRGLERAERIRRALSSRRFRVTEDGLTVTASIGVSFADPGRARTSASLISAADLFLYRAKESGRNRVVGDPQYPPTSHEGEITFDGAMSDAAAVSSMVTNDDYMLPPADPSKSVENLGRVEADGSL
jgi:diguanylate cyclase (GGDEF)-like protein